MSDLWEFTRAVIGAFDRHHDTQAASAIAYQMLLAIVPITAILFVVFGYATSDPASALQHVIDVLPIESNAFVTGTVRVIATQSAAVTVVGLLGLVWSGVGLFSVVRTALNGAWEVRSPQGYLKGKLIDFLTLLAFGVLVVVSVCATLALHLLQGWGHGPFAPVLGVFGIILPALLSFGSFLLLYRVVPNVNHCLRDVWQGALLATLLFELGKHVFAVFAAWFSLHHTAYGALGDLMLFMIWVWISSCILLIGAEVAAESCRETQGPAHEAQPGSPDQPMPPQSPITVRRPRPA